MLNEKTPKNHTSINGYFIYDYFYKGRGMSKPAKTRKEKQYHEKIANMKCVCCDLLGQKQTMWTEVHHVNEYKGKSQRAGHYCVIPLCVDCHRGKCGVHGEKTFLKILKLTEMDLLDITLGENVR